MSTKRWFKRKKYGIGWTPDSKEGWISLIIYLFVVVLLAVLFLKDAPEDTLSAEVFYFLAATFVVTLVFMILGMKKGPSMKWQWGKSLKKK